MVEVTIWLPDDLDRAVQQAAGRLGISKGEFCLRAIRAAVDRDRTGAGAASSDVNPSGSGEGGGGGEV
jgi:predicted transcriptional regulator